MIELTRNNIVSCLACGKIAWQYNRWFGTGSSPWMHCPECGFTERLGKLGDILESRSSRRRLLLKFRGSLTKCLSPLAGGICESLGMGSDRNDLFLQNALLHRAAVFASVRAFRRDMEKGTNFTASRRLAAGEARLRAVLVFPEELLPGWLTGFVIVGLASPMRLRLKNDIRLGRPAGRIYLNTSVPQSPVFRKFESLEEALPKWRKQYHSGRDLEEIWTVEF